MITLIIVDCQNDFISGTMLVKGAKKALTNIKEFITKNKNEIDKILFTVDWHPYNHSSFKKYGGQLPSHCVQFTPGACIEPKLLKHVQSLGINYEVSKRGEIEEVDQLGAFSEIDIINDTYFGNRYCFDSIVEANENSDFIICGISGNGSVKETIQNLIDNQIFPKVFISGIVSTDDGTIINKFIKDNKLEKI